MNEEWKEYRKTLLQEKAKSDDDFEKYITYIASGGLGLTITFIDKISPLSESNNMWAISLGWVLLALTLFVNLLSHFLSSKNNEKTIHDLDKDLDFEKLVEGIDARNKVINWLNLISIFSLGIGIILILIYVILNA